MFASVDLSPGEAASSFGRSDTETHLTSLIEQEKQPLVTVRTVSETAVPKKKIQVIRFHVWQDLTVACGGDAPLNATFIIEMPSTHYLNLSSPDGVIRIESSLGERLAEARLLINQAHYGLGLSQLGTRQVQFAMSPVPMYGRLDKVETVRGSARIRIDERTITVPLPETSIIFAR